jgi:POT family proton-dependent oligopeptide transporter
MSAITHPETIAIDATQDTEGLGGHPRGLTTLFFTELWERFSYYGMRAILVLYMVEAVDKGGLGFDNKSATSIYGTYAMAVYLLALPGGFVADKLFGARQTVLIGGIIIACGHFSMAVHSLANFYAGLVLIAVGTGLLKPNISTMVGSLYSKDDPRRDGGFSLFYMGINVGALLAPLVCGTLAEHQRFKSFLSAMGFDPLGSWHWGFAAAGVGMIFGLIQYVLPFSIKISSKITYPFICGIVGWFVGFLVGSFAGVPSGASKIGSLIGLVLGLVISFLRKQTNERRDLFYLIPGHPLTNVGNLPTKPKEKTETVEKKPFNPVFILAYVVLAAVTAFIAYRFGKDWVIPIVALDALIIFITLGLQEGLTSNEWKRTIAILILFFFTIFFWAAYEQKGASLNLFAKNLVDLKYFGWEMPASWLQSLTPFYVILLAPIFSVLWMRLGDRQPSSPAKFTLGLLFICLAYTLFVPACVLTAQGKVSPLWLVGLYFLEVVGEMCLSPVGLSTVTKLSPVKFVGMMMGAWFFATSLGNKLAGYLAGFYVSNNSWQLVKLYGGIATGLLVATAILALLTPTIKKLVGRQS